MNPFTLAGLIAAVLGFGAYAFIALRRGKTPELNDAIVIAVNALAISGAIRVICTVIRPEFWTLIKGMPQADSLSISAEDAVFVLIGAMSLIWISISTSFEPFKKVW